MYIYQVLRDDTDIGRDGNVYGEYKVVKTFKDLKSAKQFKKFQVLGAYIIKKVKVE